MRDIRSNGVEIAILLGSKMVNLKAATGEDAKLWVRDLTKTREKISKEKTAESLDVYRKNSGSLLNQTRTRKDSKTSGLSQPQGANTEFSVASSTHQQEPSVKASREDEGLDIHARADTDMAGGGAGEGLLHCKWYTKLQTSLTRSTVAITELALRDEGVTAELCFDLAALIETHKAGTILRLKTINMSNNPLLGRTTIPGDQVRLKLYAWCLLLQMFAFDDVQGKCICL
jgi:hypothetical protein